MSGSGNGANYGIVGAVTAKAVAVGPRARASVIENAAPSRQEFDAAIEALHAQVSSLQLPQASQQLLKDDVTKIKQLAGEKPDDKDAASGLLKGLVDKLKLVGVLLQTAVGLQAPLKAVAGWFGIPLPF